MTRTWNSLYSPLVGSTAQEREVSGAELKWEGTLSC